MNSYARNSLTKKQKEYVAALASGKTTLEVAEEFVVSHHTVRNTITKAKERIGASSTTNLIATAVDHGWIYRNGSDNLPLFFVPNEGGHIS